MMVRVRTVAGALILTALAGGARPDAPTAKHEAEGLRLVLNVAAYRLDVYEQGQRTRSYTVAVGQPGHRTPSGSFRISHVVWNPWWNPPNRAWARNASRTPPGPGNPMGRVKMYFRNLYFIHGTPNEASLGTAASHGCVRMANDDAIELARLVHRYGSPEVPRSAIDRLVEHSRDTRTIHLVRPIPLDILSGETAAREEPLELLGTAVDGERR